MIPDPIAKQFPEAARFHKLLEKEARYNALLAVLKRCVEAMSNLYICTGPMFDTEENSKEYSIASDECSAALSAAREFTEAKP